MPSVLPVLQCFAYWVTSLTAYQYAAAAAKECIIADPPWKQAASVNSQLGIHFGACESGLLVQNGQRAP